MTMHWHDIDCLMTEWITVELNNRLGKYQFTRKWFESLNQGSHLASILRSLGLSASAMLLTIHSTYVALN